MKSGGGKAKGKSFEDIVAKMLHEVFYAKHKEYKSLFDMVGNEDIKPKRDYSSGNFLNSDGDIDLGILKKHFPFSVECKHWKSLDLTLNQIMKSECKMLQEVFKKQAQVNADKKGLHPVIVFRGNRTDNFAYLETNILQKLPKNYIIISGRLIVKLDDFLNIWIEEN